MRNMKLGAHLHHTRSRASFHPFTEHNPAELRANPKLNQHWWQTQALAQGPQQVILEQPLFHTPTETNKQALTPRIPTSTALASWAHSSLQAHISLDFEPEISENKDTKGLEVQTVLLGQGNSPLENLMYRLPWRKTQNSLIFHVSKERESK